ncbi:MAG TPA: PAS domain-containing protein [Steroidobacteraceae bacterium]|nr:PAS domain-containing protein [Steroidobacteraceae bacterium]
MQKTVTLESIRSSKRGHEQLVTYWHRIKGLARFPTESQVNPAELEENWDNMFLLEVDRENPGSFRYQYVGPSIVEAYGMDPTGKDHNSNAVPNIRSMLELGAKVASNGNVGMDESWFLNNKSQKVMYRCSLVPLSSPSDREHVYFILGVMSWRREGQLESSFPI